MGSCSSDKMYYKIAKTPPYTFMTLKTEVFQQFINNENANIG